MNNVWNRIIYKAWSPFYDRIFNQGVFLHARRSVFEPIMFPPGSKVLFVGVGTGADLLLLDKTNISITATDISLSMLSKAKEKVKQHPSISFLEMDAQQLHFEDGTFDFVIASLILSVVPDANRCMQEMIRVVKPSGNIIIFDKFMPESGRISFVKRLMIPIVRLLGTDISRSFEAISSPHADKVVIKEDTPILFKGMYRKIVCERLADAPLLIHDLRA
ncbi:class I SAM-dependent methyltransferase [Aneurinibacillus sp. REN35]|uniref:class I SAM-dependent methyltransferase n=1 Tax=Aneurinibacillus sp. REN35 TaxID=3237286 RepID=UPI003528900C